MPVKVNPKILVRLGMVKCQYFLQTKKGAYCLVDDYCDGRVEVRVCAAVHQKLNHLSSEEICRLRQQVLAELGITEQEQQEYETKLQDVLTRQTAQEKELPRDDIEHRRSIDNARKNLARLKFG